MRAVVMVLLGWALLQPVQAQVRCAMPNGVLITKQFGDCPRDAVTVEPEGVVWPAPAASKANQAKPAVAAVVAPVAPVVGASSEGMSGDAWLIFLLILGGLVWAMYGSLAASGKPLFCTSCGHEGKGKTATRGMLLIEIILWLCFLVPGLIYSIWRHGSKHKVCVSCGASTLVPPNSPLALAAKRRMRGGRSRRDSDGMDDDDYDDEA